MPDNHNDNQENKRNLNITVTTHVSVDNNLSTGTIINAQRDIGLDMGDEPKVSENGLGISLADLHSVYAANGNSAEAAYEHLTNFINNNRNNPEILQQGVMALLADVSTKYDKTKKTGGGEISVVDAFERILSTSPGEQVSGLICGPMHNLVGKAMADCGMEACLITGGQLSSSGSPHATLMYKNADGHYVHVNYGRAEVIDAPNVIEASKKIYKSSGNLESSGYVKLMDLNKNSYQEFALEESAFYNEFDKRDYNTSNPLSSAVPIQNELRADVSGSTHGNREVTLGGTLTSNNGNVAKAVSLDLQYRQTPNGALLDDAKSGGLKAEFQTENKNGLYTDSKVILTETVGNTGASTHSIINRGDADDTGREEAAKSKYVGYLSGVVRTAVGLKSDITQNDNLRITNAAEGSLMLNGTVGLGSVKNAAAADGRIVLQDAVGVQSKISENVTLGGSLGAGLVVDAAQNCDNFHPAFGAKTSASLFANADLTPNARLSANVSGTGIFTKTSDDRYIQAGVGAEYKLNGNTSLFAQGNVYSENQTINLNNLNESTRNNVMYQVLVGAEINNRTRVYGAYTDYQNAYNSSRNYKQAEIGVRYTF